MHPSDRRKRAVALTTSGEEATRQGQRIGKEVGRELLGKLSAEERKQLHSLLRKFAGPAAVRQRTKVGKAS